MSAEDLLTIRPEGEGDRETIGLVNKEAFGQPQEALLVDALRHSGNLLVSLVAVLDGTVTGHIAFSPLRIEQSESAMEFLGLAPMAVLPRLQRRGIGSKLVEAGLEECRRRGTALVFVLGHPSYYPRFGFSPARPFGLYWEHEAPYEAFMVRELVPGALGKARGAVAFCRQFEDLS